MPQQKGSLVENTFGQGLFTEATGLNFPKDAASDILNCVFNQDMRVTRRLGMDFEDSYVRNNISFSNVISQYTWKNVSNISDLIFSVLQVGNTIYFYNTVNPHQLSRGLLFSFILDGYGIAGNPGVGSARCQFAEGNGKLFIAHPYCNPMNVSFDGINFTVAQNTLLIRDFDGVNDGYGLEERSTALTVKHLYNLDNQGWYASAPAGTNDTIGATTYVLAYWHDTQFNYPSNVDYWWSAKDAVGQMNSRYVSSKALGNSPAPKGHFVVDAFFTDRATSSNIAAELSRFNITGTIADLGIVSSSFYRPSVIAFYSGRVFYSGVNYNNGSINYGNRIYFSRIIERPEHVSQCYQDGDPTAEEGSDLLPSDGGVIVAPEIGTIYKLFPIGYSLIVFASNGVWSISGSTGIGFTAKDYTIAKVSSQGCLSDTSFVDIDGSPVWWTSTGIFTLGSNGGDSNTSAGVTVTSLTDSSIKRFYNNIRNQSKYYAQGCYNREQNTVIWLYNSTNAANEFLYTDALTLNTNTKAFSRWSLPTRYPVFNIQCYQSKGFNAVIKAGIIYSPTQVTFTEFNRTDYLDYGLDDYPSFVETGHSIEGHAVARFYTPYVFVYLDASDNGQLTFYHKWDFANSPDIGKFSTSQVVETSTGRSYETVRKKVRGSGRAVAMRFESVSGKPFTLIGWAALVSSNNGP